MTRYLNSWRRDRIISTTQRGVTVIDAVALERIVGVTFSDRAQSDLNRPTLPAMLRSPLNCSILLTDITGFGDPRRDDDDRRVVREAMYRILPEVLEASNVRWDQCLHEDRGDGTLTIVPPHVPTIALVDPLIPLPAAKLRRYNRQAGDPVQVQLRVALHVGPVLPDAHGLRGHALIHTARMLDAPVLRTALAATGTDLAFIASSHVYDTVIRHAVGLVDPTAYQKVRVRVKETNSTGWMYLAGTHPVAATDGCGGTRSSSTGLPKSQTRYLSVMH